MPSIENIFNNIPAMMPEELIQNLLVKDNVKIERIISRAHCTPDGQWYDQAWDEWVLLLQGEAGLRFADNITVNLLAGDYLLIPAHCKHRVEWTSANQDTLWLAIHYQASPAD